MTILLPGGGDGCIWEGARGAVQGWRLLTWPPVPSPPGRSAEEAAGGRAGGHPWAGPLGCLPALLCEHVFHSGPSSRSSSVCWLYLVLSWNHRKERPDLERPQFWRAEKIGFSAFSKAELYMLERRHSKV